MANYIDNLRKLSNSSCSYNLTKEKLTSLFFSEMFQKSLTMFLWKGLPEEVNGVQLEFYKQFYGDCLFTYDKGKYLVLFGNGAPPLDEYYRSKNYLVNNPYADINKEYEIGKNAVLIRNDFFNQGLREWTLMFASLIAEAYLSIRIGLVNNRASYILAVSTDREAEGAKAFLSDREKGEKLSYIVGKKIADDNSLTSLPYSSSMVDSIRSAIESCQYLYSRWAEGIGLTTSAILKREYVNVTDSNASAPLSAPRVDEMLTYAKLASEQINQLYGLNTSVELNPIWSSLRDDKEGGEAKEETPEEDTPQEDEKQPSGNDDKPVDGSDKAKEDEHA